MDLDRSFSILQGIVQLMAKSSDGISTREIVETYDISRRLVPKYIRILENAGYPIYTESKRYYLDQEYFVPLTLTAEESEFLFLVLERSLTLHSDQWHTLRSLLAKLSSKMDRPLADSLIARLKRESDESLSDQHFKILSQAKRQQLEVWIDYHPLGQSDPSRWRIRPLRFIQNPLSDGFYVLCYGAKHDSEMMPLALKFDRVLHVEITQRQFDIEDKVRFAEHFGTTWGVWHSEREPVRVELRFEPRHYDRLLESIWHPTQQLFADNDGYVNFSVEVAEPNEMVPWIRSWGSGVVVLEPRALRDRVINTIRRQLIAYGMKTGIQPEDSDTFFMLWAKYERKTGHYHPLIYHLLDVAAVAWQMWETVFNSSQRSWLCEMLDTDESYAKRLVTLLVGLHDIGKATPSFQRKASSLYDMLLLRGIDDAVARDVPHGTMSAVILRQNLIDQGVSRATANRIALVIGGHHGEWISKTELKNARGARGHEQWENFQRDFYDCLCEVLGVDKVHLPTDTATLNIFCTFLSGFASVCDWVGSNETYFPYEMEIVDPSDYWETALSQALYALSESGWFGWKPEQNLLQFHEIFGFAPYAMQQAIIDSVNFGQDKPRLILIEYLTGGGKTEIAFYIADLLINLFEQNGIYIAMPTQATSNQIFERFKGDYLESRYRYQSVNLQLIHSQADQNPLYRRLQSHAERDGNESRLSAEMWFQNRRRALLAPFAVGTIDQAMLSVLQTRHHFVRQYGLSHKTVIFDEIHAYDTYMNQIIERLLQWLVALESPIILLSATLPKMTRRQLLKQVGVVDTEVDDTAYPRMAIVDSQGVVSTQALPRPPTEELHIRFIDPQNLLTDLIAIYQQGGCIAIIHNTVDEAIETMRMLTLAAEIASEDLILFHARNVPEWRADIEENVLKRFGKNGDRPRRMIVVATQIIEQSLDLDFDLIITSIAPIDLLIQRAGRLHRHNRSRPEHLSKPKLYILQPEFRDTGVPEFGLDAVIYAEYILLKTWETLQHRDIMRIPDEIDSLMNSVYSEFDGDKYQEDSVFRDALSTTYDDMTLGDTGGAFRGSQFLIGGVDDDFLIGNKSYDLPDDDRNISTREIPPGIDIVCFRDDDSDLELPRLPNRKPTRDEIGHFLQFRVTIRKRAVLDIIETLSTYRYWQRIPQLADVRPIVFDNNTYHLPGSDYCLRLTPFYGLEIFQEDV